MVPSFPNSSETFVVNQIIETKKVGHDVVILTKRYRNSGNSSQKELLDKHNIEACVIELESGIPKNLFTRIFLNLFYLIKYFNYIIKVKKESLYNLILIYPFKFNYYKQFKDIDVFHAQYGDSLFDLDLMKAGYFLKGKLITTFHGYDAHFRDEKKRLKLSKKLFGAFQYSDYVTVNSSYLAKKVEALGCSPSKLKIIPMGVDIDFFTPNASKRDHDVKRSLRLLSVGRLIELKGHEYAIKAVEILKNRGYSINYTIVGDGKLFEELEQLIEKLKLVSIVELVGNKSQRELKHIYEQHDVFLMCSITDSRNRSEAQGLVTVEAQSMGLPVVAYNCGGVPDTIMNGKTGFLVDEKDVEAYADTILNFIKSESLINEMGTAAKAFARDQFSLSTMSQNFFRLYKS